MRDWLAVRADATPTATALRAFGPIETDQSYAELDDRVETLAGRLAGAGVGVDDAVAVCADTRPGYVAVVHAAQRLGAALVPINTRLTPTEIERQLGRVAPSVVVCERDTEAAVGAATDADVLSLDESGDAKPLSDVSPRQFDLPEWELDEPLAVLFTSGTTGDPKGVLLTLGNVLASATASAFRLGLRGNDCWHVPLAMYHMGGLAPVYRSVLYGTALSIQRGFDPETTREALAGASAVSLVPTMLERLLDSGPIPSLRFVLLGGAPCPPPLLRRAQRRDVPVAPTYGMTETASQIATARPEAARSNPNSVGHPLMFAEVSIVDEAGVPRETGETGEIVVSGPMVTPGYLDADTAERFISSGMRTGDRGYRDESGRVYVTGRADETILTGGENVDPTEVASVLRSHPGVGDCAVVGLPDDEWGERVAALVVPADDADPSTAALEAHCRDRLAGYKSPRTIGFVADLPRTASGTVDRSAVADRLADDGA
ncbi:o-succinylbenzoate--CoA ligase [Natronomonas moolapensis 8.8.11]|uniref:O-succinylbenzoate--CoA ligase n=1 Tax=Natronomonas moolapensis (strain DSM 18674 / CECT 7526 / JCM 14361 / 8.8.11) TaxID=268739 RepID=M1XS91_NATM8|nr:o-succinylbenzoate--CoA ligase [Natronomonas moolapensis]CCQ37213.1 o-succinylbenzoate--CoA ligase [Natronomonas moolapensis 8.8.11]